MEGPEVVELDRLYLTLAKTRLQSCCVPTPTIPPTPAAGETTTKDCLEQIKYWEEDLSRKYAQITAREEADKSLRIAPKCVRIATGLLAPQGILWSMSESKNPAHQQIGYIVLCASKLVKVLQTHHIDHEKQVQNVLFLHKCFFSTQRQSFDSHLESLEDLMRTLCQQRQLAERALESWFVMEQNRWKYDARQLWDTLRTWWASTLKYQRAVLLLLSEDPTRGLDELEEVANKSEQLFVQLDDFVRTQDYARALRRREEKDEENNKTAEVLLDEVGELVSRWQTLIEPRLGFVQAQRITMQAKYSDLTRKTQHQAAVAADFRTRLFSVQAEQTEIFRQVSTQGVLTDDKMQRTMGVQQDLLRARQELEEQLNELHARQEAQNEYSMFCEAALTTVPDDFRADFQGQYHSLAVRSERLLKEHELKTKVTAESFQHKFRRLMEEQVQRFTTRCLQLQRQRQEIEIKIWANYLQSWQRARMEAVELESHLIKLLYQAISFASVATALEQLGTSLQGATDVVEEHHWRLRQALGYQFLLSYLKRGQRILLSSKPV